MSFAELHALMPFLVMSVAICLVLILIAFWRNFMLTFMATVGGLLVTLVAIRFVYATTPIQVTPLIRVDEYGLMFCILIVMGCIGVALMAFDYFRMRERLPEEFFVMLLSATLGGMLLSCSTHFASFVLGLELLGVSLYVMISYPGRGLLSVEAGLKYLILSGVSSAFLLFGIALLYAITGSLGFDGPDKVPAMTESPFMVMASIAMIVSGVMFKLSLVPFHMWTPDVYEGAPAPVTAFIATVSKIAIFAVLLRFLSGTDFLQIGAVIDGLSAIAIASMLVGNLLALMQENVKRMLAYSSIAHFGYLLVALIAGGLGGGAALAFEACIFFLMAYLVTTLGAFGVVSAISASQPEPGARDADTLEQYQGLFWRRPVLAVVFSAMLLSLAGIPLTVGFVGKFYIFVAAATGNLWLLLGALIVGSGIGLFYYLRTIFAMTRFPDKAMPEIMPPPLSHYTLMALLALLVCLGIYPTPVIDIINTMIDSLA